MQRKSKKAVSSFKKLPTKNKLIFIFMLGMCVGILIGMYAAFAAQKYVETEDTGSDYNLDAYRCGYITYCPEGTHKEFIGGQCVRCVDDS